MKRNLPSLTTFMARKSVKVRPFMSINALIEKIVCCSCCCFADHRLHAYLNEPLFEFLDPPLTLILYPMHPIHFYSLSLTLTFIKNCLQICIFDFMAIIFLASYVGYYVKVLKRARNTSGTKILFLHHSDLPNFLEYSDVTN